MNSKLAERPVLTFDMAVRQMTEMAIMLPLGRQEYTKPFTKLMDSLKLTPADTTYLKRIDHAKIFTDQERAVLLNEANGYLLALFMYYTTQLQDYTDWQQNAEVKLNQAHLYGLVMDNAIYSSLYSLGWSDEAKVIKESKRLYRTYQKYIKARTVDRVYLHDYSFAPVFKEMLITNVGKRIELIPGQTKLVSKYADKLHSCAKKYFYYTQKHCRVVGINVVIPAKAFKGVQ